MLDQTSRDGEPRPTTESSAESQLDSQDRPVAMGERPRSGIGQKLSTPKAAATGTSTPAQTTPDALTAPSSVTPAVAGDLWARREAQFKLYRDERLASLVRPSRMTPQPLKSRTPEVCR